MKNTIAVVLVAMILGACGAMPISEADKKDIQSGSKALLVTNNRQLSDYLYIIPIFIDTMGGRPNQIVIEYIDGKPVPKEWKRVNQELALEPGEHVIEASCAVEITDMNRDVNDTSDNDIQWSDQSLEFTFEGGKKYRIYAQEYINGTCTMGIEAMK